jgi:hypothetical protein
MGQSRAQRRSPDVFDFEGEGDEARGWLDTAYGTTLRLTGPMGKVSHHRLDHGSVAFDHVKIDAGFAYDADPMPVLVVVDLLTGRSEYTRDHVTDRLRGGETVLTSGWGMPYAGSSEGFEIRATSFTAEAVSTAVADVAPDYPWQRISFGSYLPRSAAAGALWRATVDQLSVAFPGEDAPVARGEALRLLGHTLLHTFPNNVVDSASNLELDRDSRDATPSTVRRAVGVVTWAAPRWPTSGGCGSTSPGRPSPTASHRPSPRWPLGSASSTPDASRRSTARSSTRTPDRPCTGHRPSTRSLSGCPSGLDHGTVG